MESIDYFFKGKTSPSFSILSRKFDSTRMRQKDKSGFVSNKGGIGCCFRWGGIGCHFR